MCRCVSSLLKKIVDDINVCKGIDESHRSQRDSDGICGRRFEKPLVRCNRISLCAVEASNSTLNPTLFPVAESVGDMEMTAWINPFNLCFSNKCYDRYADLIHSCVDSIARVSDLHGDSQLCGKGCCI